MPPTAADERYLVGYVQNREIRIRGDLMATQVRVQATKGKGKFMHGEVSGGSSGEYGEGSHDFKIGRYRFNGLLFDDKAFRRGGHQKSVRLTAHLIFKLTGAKTRE